MDGRRPSRQNRLTGAKGNQKMYTEEFRTISGTYPDGRTRAIHFEIDGTTYCAQLDMSRPVTLKRFQELKEKLKAKTGIEFNYLCVEHHVYEFDCDPDDKDTIALIKYGDIGGRKTTDKTYQFWADQNRLLIWDRDYPVYENNNGEICNDPTALADCLC